ncbi:DUF2278 family protein [Photobacterium sp. WH24]|uniref:DUF2278 family protein n=1 Tax=Photobacterium sp. WH24 TaxID=2827237 RepID=UPI001C493520|nr:DUF2278 family protein [Photobacterium sp. WH24]MBV7262505.1 DUF2278 family protein [Photobacterium sp. WH24]
MPIHPYGVWCANAVRVTAETAQDDPDSPHIHLFYEDGRGEEYRASINVKSKGSLSELAYYRFDNFQHPILTEISELGMGWHELDKKPGGGALDYIRGNLLNFEDGILLPHDIPGVGNDLLDLIMPILRTASSKKSKIYLFGEPYSDMKGIHDVHMNQGSAGRFAQYNGVWQDGGVIIEDADTGRHIALFLAFGSQAIHTDETTGHALPNSQVVAEILGHTRPEPGDGDILPPRADDIDIIMDDRRVAIVGALVNPEGPEGQPEYVGKPELVYLMNRSKSGISLGGWKLLNQNDEAHTLSQDIWLAPGEIRTVTLGSVPLSNRGGLISLLDQNGLKVDGVSYTREEAKKSGEVTLFRV